MLPKLLNFLINNKITLPLKKKKKKKILVFTGV